MENQILDVLHLQKSALLRLSTSSASDRISKLRKIESYLMQHKEELCDALYADFKKPASEVLIAEMLGVKREINHTIKHLKSWMKPQSVSTPLMLLGTKGLVQYEAKGLCLSISPWNYPFNLSICPLVHAIAAGNAVILKPSELSPATAAFIQKMISSLFDKSEVAVFEGDASVSTFLLEQKFDHIFFTGSPAIGKVVMAAAAKHLTSVTLELGGKSPAIVGPEVNVEEAAAKIAWGKFLNNGQTCIAPDYLYVHEKNYYSFLQALEATVETFYGANVAKSKDYARIVNRRHFDRIASLLEDAKEMLERAGAKNVQGYEGDGTPGRGIHEMGTARMGRDPKTSVLNGNNQVWDAPNVFVTDGSFMASANCVNPSLTYMAFTARAVDFAVSELKKGNL